MALPIRGKSTGMTLREQISQGDPTSIIGRCCLITEHATASGFVIIRASTDIAAMFGKDDPLTKKLLKVQSNAGPTMYLVVACFSPGHITTGSIRDTVTMIIDSGMQVEFFAVDTDADLAFMQELEDTLQFFQNNKRWLSSVCRFRGSRLLSLDGKSVSDGTDRIILSYPGHGFVIGEKPVFYGTANYDGSHTLLETSTADEIHFSGTFQAETFGADAVIEEHPDDYAASFGNMFETLNHNKGLIVAGTTQDDHFPVVLGQCLQQPLDQNIGRRDQGGVTGTVVDPVYKDALESLICHGAVVLKTDPANENETIINDDTVMWLSGSVRNWQDRRVICEAARQVFYYGNPLVNSSKYERTDEGALAAAEDIATGLKAMRDNTPRVISDYELTVSWGAEGALVVGFIIYSLNNIKIIDTSITLEQP